MPVHDMRTPDTRPPVYPCHVVDGRGEHVPFCVTADTDTGEVCRYAPAPDGTQPLIGPDLRPTVVKETRPLPLTFEPCPSPWSPRPKTATADGPPAAEPAATAPVRGPTVDTPPGVSTRPAPEAR